MSNIDLTKYTVKEIMSEIKKRIIKKLWKYGPSIFILGYSYWMYTLMI